MYYINSLNPLMTEKSSAGYEDHISIKKDELLCLENCESTQLDLLEVNKLYFSLKTIW